MNNFSIENQHIGHTIAGIDEVGRGALAGPVVVGVVIIKDQCCCGGIKDSKQLSKSKRKILSDMIWDSHHCSIGMASNAEIDSIGLNPAILLAINRALEMLMPVPTMLLMDGNYKFSFSIPSLDIIGGDRISISIAAASIIAKVYRDELMINLSQTYPNYLWNKNVGYGTADHLNAIKTHGLSKHHRASFIPATIKDIYNSLGGNAI